MTDSNAIPLLNQPLVQVRQKAKLFELRNQYDLFDSAGSALGSVQQVNQSAFTVLARIASDLDVALPVELEVRQHDQRVLLLRKPWFRMTVEVLDPAGHSLGTIRKRIRMGKARFELHDPDGRTLGEARAENWRAKDFAVSDVDRVEVGRVTKEWAGAARELFTDADHYVIQRPNELAEPMRSLVLATPFAIDLIMKQKDRG